MKRKQLSQAIAIKLDYAEAYWNLIEVSKTVKDAEGWIDKCLEADRAFINANLTKAALRFYQGEKHEFDYLMRLN